MSKPIKLTPEDIASIRKDFEEVLKTAKASDGRVSYTKVLSYINRKATLYFTEVAWNKMQALLREYSTEVGWHGLAKRGEDESKDEYIIYDILEPYPQYVTGATVTTDQKEYDQWLYSEELDDVFNDIRFHGHSHVNMPTNPSSVDTNHWDGIIEQLEGDMFYIFAIWNKKGDKTVKIYDFAKNILFDTIDIDVKLIAEENGIAAFINASKERVKEKKYTTPTYGHNYTGYQSYGGTSTTKVTTPNNNTNSAKNDDKKSEAKSGNKTGKRKGKRVTGSQLSIFNDGIGGW